MSNVTAGGSDRIGYVDAGDARIGDARVVYHDRVRLALRSVAFAIVRDCHVVDDAIGALVRSGRAGWCGR